MTTVATALPTASTPAPAQVPVVNAAKCEVPPEIFQDILYEILANGLDPREARVTSAQIEQFLFEHARAPKKSEEFVEFFKKYELSTNPDDHLKLIDLKVVPPSEHSVSRAAPAPVRESRISNDNATHGETTSPKIEAKSISRPEKPEPEKAEAAYEAVIVQQLPTRSLSTRTLWAAAAGIAMLLGIGTGLGFAIANLQSEVSRAKTVQQESQKAVQELQQRISGLQSEVVRNGQSVQRLEPQLDLLIETIAPNQPAQSSEPNK